MTSGRREKSINIGGLVLWARGGDDLDAVVVDIELSLALAQEIGEQLNSAHANSVVSVIAKRLILVVFRDLGAEHLFELAEKTILSQSCRIEHARPVNFFFMRASIRHPDLRAFSWLISGRIMLYASPAVAPWM